MTGEIEPQLHGEQLQDAEIVRPVCEVSAAAALEMVVPLLELTAEPDSVLYRTMNDRAARMSSEARFGLSSALLVDPSRMSRAPRYMQQTGEFAPEAVIEAPEEAIILWGARSKADIPKLRVPEGAEQDVMDLADRLQMRGGGPTIFSREEAGRVALNERSQVVLHGAGRRAMLERFDSAIALRQAGYDGAILATVDPTRILKDGEKEAVKDFAADATNEYELMVASALKKGFVLDRGSRFGVKTLADGSFKVDMVHPESGAKAVILAPVKSGQHSGLFHAYRALSQHGRDILGKDFSLEGSDLVHVTSSHYGPMVVMNNLRAVDELRTSLGSIQVVGDNRPISARPALTHMIEIGYTFDAANKAVYQSPSLRNALLSEEA